MVSLSEQVRTALAESGSLEHANIPTPSEFRDLTQYELDLRDWGIAFGIAYGIARADDPFEPDQAVCLRALAWAEFNGSPIGLPKERAVD